MIALHDAEGLAAAAGRHGCDPQHVRKLSRLVLQRGRSLEEALEELGGRLPSALVEELARGSLELVERRDSAQDGATKLLLRTAKGARLESVLLRAASGRTTLCLSIQSGCAAGCAFCATGDLGLRGRLSLDEVLEQVTLGRRLAAGEARLVRNLVFMGMGEPLFEQELLLAVLERLLDERAFAFAPRRVCVSTVGVPEGMLRLAERFPGVRQALSLHSAVQAERERLVPPAARHSLEELRAAVLEVGRLTGGRVFVEYLLLAGRTDRPGDEQALAAWLAGLPVHLNLIPYNPGGARDAGRPAAELEATPRAAREAFALRMRERGVPTTLRRSLGADVAAACGELAGAANSREP